MKKLLFFIIFNLVVSSVTFAHITVNTSLIYKKGIDKDLVLVSELHSIEDFFGMELKVLEMKNGTKARLKAYFIHQDKDYGPSSLVRVTGDILNSTGKLVKKIKSGEVDIPLGENRTIVYKDIDNQVIELSLEPYIQ